MQVKHFFDARTWTLTYVAWDETTRDAVILDPVLDFDPATGRVWQESVLAVIAWVEAESLTVRAILETHAHADHLSGAQALKARFGVPVIIGAGITRVQAVFAPIFGLGPDFTPDGSQFDRLLVDEEEATFGSLTVKALHTPGHTPACMSYVLGDAVFTGDALFMPDYGVGRCDFPHGDAGALYTSVHDTLYLLPDSTRVFVGHDYQPEGRPVAFETTIGASKASNVQLRADTPRETFVKARHARDSTLAAPRLLLPSIQVNIDAGRLPKPHANGRHYLLTPLKIS
jgi:glyoxylase-like metal-dependent hydrolase (beta-lactamase superfamily II)